MHTGVYVSFHQAVNAMRPHIVLALAVPLCLLLSGCASTPNGQDKSMDAMNLVSTAVERYRVPGMVVTLLDSGGIRQVASHGTRVAGGNTALEPDDYFHIGSTGKSLLAVLAAQAVEQGLLAWDTRLFDVLPDWQSTAHPDYANITLTLLLQSRAGLHAYTDQQRDVIPELTGTLVERRHAFLQHVLARPPATMPQDDGFAHVYSNASFVMAAVMLEQVSGIDFEALVQQYLATVLEKEAVWGWPNTIDAAEPWGHRMRGRKVVEVFAPDHDYVLPDVLGPAGNLSMTATDFARYIQQHLRGLRGENNAISSDSYHLIHYGLDGFSFGVANGRYAGHRLSGMDGSATTFFCRALLFPDDDFALTIMINAATIDDRSPAADYVSQQLLNERFKPGWASRLKMWLGLTG